MGSEEFVEEFNLMLKERAILYINADVGFSGNEYFRAGASPVMHDLIWEITQVISFEFLLKTRNVPGMGHSRWTTRLGQLSITKHVSRYHFRPSGKHKIFARNTNF